MSYQRGITWLGGDDNLSEINRIFNLACLIGALFCFLSAVESWMASLSPFLVAGNIFYTIVLVFAYYFSRFRGKFNISRIISIITLLVVYFPALWFFNGGNESAIPYFIPLLVSFLTISVVGRRNTPGDHLVIFLIVILFCLEVVFFILINFRHPEWIYQYTDQATQEVDIVIGAVFAVIGNFMIILAAFNMYYRQLEKTEQLVFRDSMTGLYNHQYIVSNLEEEIDRSGRYQIPLSIIVLDVDNFKKVNDTYGHVMGDSVLKKVSKTIKSECRTIDKIGRYGGDEFLIVLPETCLDKAVVLARRLLESVESLALDETGKVTISLGIAQWKNEENASSFIERADDNLYEAKRAGRNRFIS